MDEVVTNSDPNFHPESLKMDDDLVDRLLKPMQDVLVHAPTPVLKQQLAINNHHPGLHPAATDIHPLLIPQQNSADSHVAVHDHSNNFHQQGMHLPSIQSPHHGRRLLRSPPPELSGEPYIIYENAQMISELETKLVMVFHPLSYTLEISCVVLGIQEGNCLQLYLDYKSLYAALLQPDMVSKFKKRRRNVAIEFLLGRLTIERDKMLIDKWTLTLDNPKNPRDRRYYAQTNSSIASNENSSSIRSTVRRGSQGNNDHHRKNSLSHPKQGDAVEDLSHNNDSNNEVQQFRRDQLLDERLREDLKKLIREKPDDIQPIDVEAFYVDKSNGKLSLSADQLYDLPLLPHAMIKSLPNGITNFLGKVWLGTKDLEADIAITTVPEPLGENHTFTKTNILMEVMEIKKVVSPTSSGLPKITVKSPRESEGFRQNLLSMLSTKSKSNDSNERHVYDFLSTSGHVLPPLKTQENTNSNADEAPRGKFKMLGTLLFSGSGDAHSDGTTTATVSISNSPSLDATSFDANTESVSGKNRIRRKTLNSTPAEKPTATIKYSYGTNSLASLTIDEQQENSAKPSAVSGNGVSRTHRRTFGMDPLSLPGHFSTPGGSALAAAALNPFQWKKKVPDIGPSTNCDAISPAASSES